MKIDLLIMRFLVVNLTLGYVLWVGADQAKALLADDTTYISEAILATFAVAMCLCAARILHCSNALNKLKRGVLPDLPLNALQERLDARTRPIEYLGYLCVTLGFLGTVWGFRIALSGINVERVADVDQVGALITSLVDGMGIALSTTIVGVLCYIVIGVSTSILDGGHSKLYVQVKNHDGS